MGVNRLPPAEKLPLALRKNVRDEWENNKADLEKQLSDLMGTEWTIDIDPLAIWPYHNDGYAKESLGNCLKSYVEGALYQLKYVSGKNGDDDFKKEVNAICHAHVLTLEFDDADPPRFSTCGCDVQDGKLRILFSETGLGYNTDYCLQDSTLLPALNAAPHDAPLSFTARANIRAEYDPKIGETRKQIADLLGKGEDEITLNPNFEANFTVLSAAAEAGNTDLQRNWQESLGSWTLRYFEALASQMKSMKVDEDEMVREGLLEAVSANEYVMRVVDKLKYDSYCEADIEEGKLYLQSTASNWGVNIDYVAQKLMDRL
ncbi:hypothetical protein MMYC01_208296 [Madurella mycetomatis]|uniref:Uncharacterized protein n=1 Tax=Madurella mycetomatis TaxID=100816 RepID=A0A175VVX1_9PEZI|nr:hypothetical protein MMYC01_208296 [Madurella mycetomatis]